MGIKISELPQASQLTSDDIIPIVQSGETKKVSVSNVVTNSHNTNQANTYSSDYINNNFNKVNVQTSQTTSTTDTYSCSYINGAIPEMLNSYSTSNDDAYSCNYINGLNTYSTTEQRIGTWIDGKPLYRITIVLPNGTGQTTQKNYTLSDYGVTNVNEIFMVHPSYYNNLNQNIPFNFYDGSTYEVFVSPTTLSILVTYSPIANRKMVITLEYTKTTD